MFAQRETQRPDPLFEVKVLKPHRCPCDLARGESPAN